MTDPTEKDSGMTLSPSDIRQVLDVLATSVWDEAVVTVGDVTIAVARNGATLPGTRAAGPALALAAPAPPAAPAPAAPAPAAAAPLSTVPASAAPAAAAVPSSSAAAVTAPSVGVFWRAPEPGAAPFVEVGDRVVVGQELCIVEVMKLMHRVPAATAGTVTAIHVGNGDTVEFGTVLFSIEPE